MVPARALLRAPAQPPSPPAALWRHGGTAPAQHPADAGALWRVSKGAKPCIRAHKLEKHVNALAAPSWRRRALIAAAAAPLQPSSSPLPAVVLKVSGASAVSHRRARPQAPSSRMSAGRAAAPTQSTALLPRAARRLSQGRSNTALSPASALVPAPAPCHSAARARNPALLTRGSRRAAAARDGCAQARARARAAPRAQRPAAAASVRTLPHLRARSSSAQGAGRTGALSAGLQTFASSRA
jgi:hypothetical protein